MPSTYQESTVLPNMISPPKPAAIAEGVLSTSDKGPYVNLATLDLTGLAALVVRQRAYLLP
jgi:hypothetical protein